VGFFGRDRACNFLRGWNPPPCHVHILLFYVNTAWAFSAAFSPTYTDLFLAVTSKGHKKFRNPRQTMKNGNISNAQECAVPAFNQLMETTDRILADLERDSQFFDENLLLPEFDPTGDF
jgi:hypothetical protein